MSTSIKERVDKLVSDFDLFDDWLGRYEYLIELGKNLPPLDDSLKIPEFKIPGCQSNVWIYPDVDESTGSMSFKGDSDAMITKGLVAVLITVFDNQPAASIAEADIAFLSLIGMDEHLSSTRKNGLGQMIKRMKMFARSAAGIESPTESDSPLVPVQEAEIEKAIRTVYDPEIPVNVYDLGLIYGTEVSPDNSVFVSMTLTTPNCPAAASLPNQVEQAVRGVEGVTDATVEITFDPPYSPDMMTDAAKLELGLL